MIQKTVNQGPKPTKKQEDNCGIRRHQRRCSEEQEKENNYLTTEERGEALKIPYWEKPYRNNYLTFEKEFQIFKVQGGQRRAW